MSRREKELRILLDAERHLRDAVVVHLREVAAGRGTLFFSTGGRWASREGAAVLAEAREIASRAERLGEESVLAREIISAFHHANDTSDHHRLGPIRLAQTLLERISILCE